MTFGKPAKKGLEKKKVLSDLQLHIIEVMKKAKKNKKLWHLI